MTLERLLRSALGRWLPPRVAREAVDDLIDDHRRVRAERGAVFAGAFLIREAFSLLGAAAAGAIASLPRSSTVMRRDAVHAARAVRRKPWASITAVIMLAAGLAAVAAAAGLGATLLFRPVSPRYAEAVVRLASTDVSSSARLAFAEAELQPIRDHLAGVASVAGANLQPVVLRAAGSDTHTLAEVIAGPYFDIVGLTTLAGRPLVDADARPAAPPAIVISDTLWRDRYGRDPAAVGATVRLNGRAFTVAGVAAGSSTSSLLGGSVEAWITVAHADAVLDRDWRTNPDRRWWSTLVRLLPESGPSDAESSSARVAVALERATADLAARFPEAWRERRLTTMPGTVLTGSQRAAAVTLSIVLTVFAALIFAAAAANVGALFMAASAADRGRAAIQLAIGSGRAAILRRHLIEGAMLGWSGGAVAVALYVLIRRQLAEVALLPTLSLRLDLPLDATMIAAILAAGSVTGMVLALGPAVWLMRLDLAQTLRDGAGRGAGGAGLSRARRILVAAQVAISIVLLAGATLFARSVETLRTLDVGFPRDGLIAMDFDLEPSAASAAMLPALAREALDRAQALPGVVAAAMANRAPIDASTPRVEVRIPDAGGSTIADATLYQVTDRYFETVGLPIVSGRAFSAAEVTREDEVVIVNETLAARLWPDGDAIGQPLELLPQGGALRIIGVARDSKYRSLSEPSQPHLYRPVAPRFNLALLVRTEDNPRRAMLAVQQALDGVGPGVVGFFPRTLDDHLAVDTLTTRAAARAAATLGALALMLSAAGLYGMVMWFVEVRRREIGVRVALGASANDVRRLVVGQAALAAGPGLLIGLLMAAALTAFGRSLFIGVGVVDPLSLATGIAALGVIVLAASYWPSRKATRVDPAIVLRES
jgi:predicted permease